jgi:Flp pilus assembly protein TadD
MAAGDQSGPQLDAVRGEQFARDLADLEQLIENDPSAAVGKANAIIAAAPDSPDAHRLLGLALRNLGRPEEAARAEFAAIRASSNDPDLALAANALRLGDLPSAERALRTVLQRRPSDAAANRMLGEVAASAGSLRDAEALFRRSLELAPAFDFARLL